MDKIGLLRARKEELRAAGADVRAQIRALTDEDSFVELAAFSFSENAFYGDGAHGEGVVTGFATIGGYPYYLVAQNFAVYAGGLSKAGCEKIVKTLDAAEKNGTPVVYLLRSHGVRVGEGVNVLEGIAGLLCRASRLKGTVMQFAILDGEVYGSAAALASLCDVVLFTEGSAMCVHSPFVLSAKAGKNLKPVEVGGYRALTDALLPALSVRDMREAASKILAISDLVRIPMIDAELNDPLPALDRKADAAALVSLLEGGIELGANGCPEVKTVLGRLGGIAVAAVVFDGARLNAANVRKIRAFAQFAGCYGLPFVTFVDCLGVEPSLGTANSAALAEISEYLSVLDAIDGAKVAVVTGRAVGLGYSLFAAKSVGFDYTFALATAEIALFESAAGADIQYASGKEADREALAARYREEVADPFNAAKNGYLDDIIEPRFLKQYLVASIQTLVR